MLLMFLPVLQIDLGQLLGIKAQQAPPIFLLASRQMFQNRLTRILQPYLFAVNGGSNVGVKDLSVCGVVDASMAVGTKSRYPEWMIGATV